MLIAVLSALVLKSALCVLGVSPERKKAIEDMVSIREDLASNPANVIGEHPPSRRDPWATPYRITIVGTNIEVRSAGPDGKFGTPDDISAP